MDGVYIIFILVEHHLSFFSFYYIFQVFPNKNAGFIILLTSIFTFTVSFYWWFNCQMGLWRTLCLQSNIEEVLSLSFSIPISSGVMFYFPNASISSLSHNLQWRKDFWEEFIIFIFMYSVSLSFGFNIYWYSSNLFPNAFPRI